MLRGRKLAWLMVLDIFLIFNYFFSNTFTLLSLMIEIYANYISIFRVAPERLTHASEVLKEAAAALNSFRYDS